MTAAASSDHRVLIVDDEEVIRDSIADYLGGEGIPVETAGSGEEALERLKAADLALVLTDLRMPGMDGLSLIRRGREVSPSTLFAVFTAHGSMDVAIAALREGAVDFIPKPVVFEDLLLRVRRILGLQETLLENARLKHLLHRGDPPSGIIGGSPAMRDVLALVERYGPTDRPVLITGASGTGKELVARALHARSERSEGPFLAVNCAAVPETLFESELFGHKRGAFTGADRDKEGLLQLAENGSIFLDEVAEIPAIVQAKLLRAIDSREVLPLGAGRPVPVGARVLAATNRDLRVAVREGAFREDLFFRISVLQIRLPSLAERPEDIPALVAHLIEKHRGALRSPARAASRGALELLSSQDWRGNVRELENVIQRALILARGEEITPAELPHLDSTATLEEDRPLKATVRDFERRHIRGVIAQCGGDKAEAARRLDISLASLYAKLKEDE